MNHFLSVTVVLPGYIGLLMYYYIHHQFHQVLGERWLNEVVPDLMDPFWSNRLSVLELPSVLVCWMEYNTIQDNVRVPLITRHSVNTGHALAMGRQPHSAITFRALGGIGRAS